MSDQDGPVEQEFQKYMASAYGSEWTTIVDSTRMKQFEQIFYFAFGSGIRLRSQGLWEGVSPPMEKAGSLVFPTKMAPASFRRATTVASYVGMKPSSWGEPAVVSIPRV